MVLVLDSNLESCSSIKKKRSFLRKIAICDLKVNGLLLFSCRVKSWIQSEMKVHWIKNQDCGSESVLGKNFRSGSGLDIQIQNHSRI